jgi:hypothetical protein
LRMGVRHPEAIGECAVVLWAYGMAPHRFLHKSAAIYGNLKGAQKGIDWQTLKDVAQTYPIHVLGGADDPLMQEQLSQWLAIKKIAPKTTIRILEGLGHIMTLDVATTLQHLIEMEVDTHEFAMPS